MPINGVEQPDIIRIDEELRLRKYNGKHDFALCWYQDEETVKLVDGLSAKIYNADTLDRMYRYLDEHGELYFIEVFCGDAFMPIGDVAFSAEDIPIVIGDAHYRGKGIGKKVIHALLKRAKALGYESLKVREIYYHNDASRALFTNIGFKLDEDTGTGHSLRLDLRTL